VSGRIDAHHRQPGAVGEAVRVLDDARVIFAAASSMTEQQQPVRVPGVVELERNARRLETHFAHDAIMAHGQPTPTG